MGFDMKNRARDVLDRTKATGVEAKTVETVSPGAYKDGQLEILSNYKTRRGRHAIVSRCGSELGGPKVAPKEVRLSEVLG